CDYADDLQIAGAVAAYSQQPTLENAKRIRGQAKKLADHELSIGLAAGLAMQGKYEQAVAAAKTIRLDPSRGRAMILKHQPTKERVEQFLKEFPLDGLYGGLGDLAESLIMIGDEA